MQVGNDLVLVTGATGHQGGAVARELLAKGHKVRVMTRKPDSPAAKELGKLGAQVVPGDLDNAASVEAAVKGAWGVFSVQNTWEAGVVGEEEQGKRLAKIARDQGVQHFVYTSVASAHRKTGIPHFENKYRVEETVRSLGFPSHVIIRPVFFMENLLGPWLLPGIQQGKLVMGMKPDTKLQMIAVGDIGKHGARAFEKHAELNRKEIDLAGDELTMPETARLLSEATHQKVEFVQAPIEEVRKASEDYALMLEWFDRVGYDVDIERLAKESGIRPTKFAEWAGKQQWATTGAAR